MAGAGALLVVFGLACGPAPRSGQAPDRDALQSLRLFLMSPPPAVPFRAHGHAHFESPDGEVDGAVEVRVDPPRRAWLELRARALFGLVGERVVVSLPGDEHLLVYRQRADDLERLALADSPVAFWGLGCGVPGLLALLSGHVPWPDDVPPADLEARARVQGSGRGDVREYRLRLGPGPRQGDIVLRLAKGELQRLEWWAGGERRLAVQYDRFVSLGASRYPTRVRLQVPGERLRAEIDLERLEPQAGFAARDFEIGAAAEPREVRKG